MYIEYINAVQQSGRLDMIDCIISNRIYSRGKRMNMKKKMSNETYDYGYPHSNDVIYFVCIFTLIYGEMWQIFKGQICSKTKINLNKNLKLKREKENKSN